MKRPIITLLTLIFLTMCLNALAGKIFKYPIKSKSRATVQSPLVSGTLSPSVQYVGYNGRGSTITGTAATGGTGTYTYQWQLSTDNSNFYDMSGVTGLTLTPSWPHTSALYYRIATTSGAAIVYSNAAAVLIDSPPTALSNNLSSSRNYILTIIPRKAGFNPALLPSYTSADVMQTVQYLDGLGRPEQTVQVRASPNAGYDLVQPFAYDEFGQENKKYLPYAAYSNDGSFKSNALTANQGVFGFYNPTGGGSSSSGLQQGNGAVTIPTPFTETKFEASPLNRPMEQGAPGTDWQIGANTLKMGYGVNAANTVRKWIVASNGNGASGTTYYAAGTLYIDTVKDENGHPAVTFKDMEGHVVAKRVRLDAIANKWVMTSYIYDDFGNLAYVIPPIPTGITYPTTFTETNTIFKNFMYAYHYDGRNRLIKKWVFGKGWNYIVYNQLDQVVATQDSVQIGTKQWSYTKYDGQGRVVQTGTWDNNAVAITQSALQAMVNGFTTLWETASPTGYSNNAWPTTYATLLTTSYYDDYANVAGLPAAYAMPGDGTTRVTGLPLATQTAVLGSTSNKLWTVNYYDRTGRAIKTYKQHYLLGGTASTLNYDTVRTRYNFNEQPTRVERSHFKKSGTNAVLQITLADSMQYDHMGRLLFARNKVNSSNWVILSRSYYNEIGQLKIKRLHSENNGSTYLEDEQFMYNERGWLRAMGSASSALFNLELKYNNPDGGATAQYNGNISQSNYHYAGIPASILATDRQFSYTYDDLNRLKNATLNVGTALNEALTYDELGNITALTRGGQSSYSALGYTYTNGLLTAVAATAGAGFTPRTYAYDKNGNATTGGTTATQLAYNMLNLPTTVKNAVNTVIMTYTYDAAGQKLRTVSTADGTREYISGINYEGTGIKTIATSEGRIMNNGGAYSYQYDLKDHLGNVRVTFDKDPTSGTARIIQEDDYYSFGLRKGVYDYGNGNRYLYNGKERQADLQDQYDYGARFYDPVIARWTSVDPLAEKSRRWSPYNYAVNNPIRFIDPDGREWKDPKDKKIADNLQKDISKRVTQEQKTAATAAKTIIGLAVNLALGKGSKGDLDKMNSTAANLTAANTNISNLNASSAELTAMGATTDMKFTFKNVTGSSGSTGPAVNGLITMDVVSGSSSNKIHEAAHGYDFWKGTQGNSVQGTEIKPYSRQFSFDPESVKNIPSLAGSVSGIGDINTPWVWGIKDPSTGEFPYAKAWNNDEPGLQKIVDSLKQKP